MPEQKPAQATSQSTTQTEPGGRVGTFDGMGKEIINQSAVVVLSTFTPDTDPVPHIGLFKQVEMPAERIKILDPDKPTNAERKASIIQPRRAVQRPKGMPVRRAEQARQQNLAKTRAELGKVQA